jgi:hypothetical protein
MKIGLNPIISRKLRQGSRQQAFSIKQKYPVNYLSWVMH